MLSPATRIGPYEILTLLGQGGMGEVYRARDTVLGREVAIKVLPPDFTADPDRVARFQREAQALAALSHPNIAAIYGFEQSGGMRALVMELVEGPTLADRIAKGRLPVEESLTVARQIAEALEAAHEKGIVHRDLKPANVKIRPDGQVKVLDFGLAKALDREATPQGDPSLSPTLTIGATAVGVIMGTAGYMSPEQAAARPVDKRADIWSFGVVLWEMLTGRVLFSGETIAHTLADVLRAEIDVSKLPVGTPAQIRILVGRCLDRNVKNRLRDIGEARIAIEEAATEAPPLAAVALAAPQRFLLWLIASVAVACALVLGFLYFRQSPASERVLRYSISAPEKGTIDSFAMSPDGRTLAISAETVGKRQLWIRPLDALGPQALGGTDDATFPFWSTDSGWIGFFAQGKLKKISVAGGPAQTLCDAPTGRGGTWNREGIIVFANISGPVQRVAAAGGVPAAVNRAEGSQRFPLFLPDGRRFLYLSGEKDGLFVASLDSQSAQRVQADHSSVAWLPPREGSKNGYLLFVRERTLMAQPFDAQTLQPAGDLFPVAEQVSFGRIPGSALASVSSNGVLVYSSGHDLGKSQLVWYDRGGKVLGNAGEQARGFEFALSPDERTVAAMRVNASGHSDIWLHDLARAADTRFTFHASSNQQAVWSPDGSRIVFSSTRGHMGFDLYVRDASGAGQDDLLLGRGLSGANKHADDWSRDGRFLLYADYSPTTRADLWALPLADGDRKPVPFLRTEFTETQGQFSPDSHWVAYASDESGAYEVYVRPFPPGAGKWKISIGGGQLPRWRRDGKELFYLAPDHRLMAVAVKAAPGTHSAFETAAPEALFDTRAASFPTGLNYFVYAVASDGKRFLVSNSTGETAEAPLTVVVNWLAAVKK